MDDFNGDFEVEDDDDDDSDNDDDDDDDDDENDDQEEEHQATHNELNELRGFMISRPDGRILLRDFRLNRLKKSTTLSPKTSD
jgi:hypothetical protein